MHITTFNLLFKGNYILLTPLDLDRGLISVTLYERSGV